MAPLLTPLRPIDRDTLKILNKHLETGSGLVNKHVVDPVLDFIGPVITGILRGLDNQNMNYSIDPKSARVKGPGNTTATATVAGNILDLPAKVVAEGAGLLGAGPETQKLIHTAADLLIPTPPVARALKKVKTGAQTLGTIKLPKTTSKIPITPSVKPNVTSTNGLTISPQLARRTVANELSDIESLTGLTSSKVTKTAEVVKPKSKRVLLTEAEKRAKRRQHQANRKFREALPSDADLLSEFKAQGIPEELIPLYKKNARSGWNRTRKAASQQTVETHAGHQRNLLASGDPLKQGVSKLDTTATTGRTAKLEYGPDNLKKGAREGSMNQHVSDITGMPSNWRKDIKQWYQHHRGEPSLHYDSDWTVKQMDLLEAIPENWSKSKVMARIEQIRQLTPTTAGQQYKAIQKELAEEMMRESQRLNDLF